MLHVEYSGNLSLCICVTFTSNRQRRSSSIYSLDVVHLCNMFKRSVLFMCSFFLMKISAYQNSYCDLKCQNGKHILLHTVCQRNNEKCGPHPRCGPEFKVIKLDDDTRQFVVNLHNDLRNKVAAGNESRGAQPSASNMQMMTYDMELEFIAQCWANTCNASPLKHDKCRSTNRYTHVGQNLAYIKSTAPHVDLKYAIETMIMYWYNEVEIFKSEWIRNTQNRGPNFKIGHYTQMIWAETKQIGCAVSFYTKVENDRKWHYYFLVCNYGPGGNYLGQSVYAVGPPCKVCGKTKGCNNKYTALCGRPAVNATKIDRDFKPMFDF